MKKMYLVLIIILVVAIVYVYKRVNPEKVYFQDTENTTDNSFLDEYYLNPKDKLQGEETTEDEDLFPGSVKEEEDLSGYIDLKSAFRLQVDLPEEGATLTSPFVVSGRAVADYVKVEVKNKAGNTLISEKSTVRRKDEQGRGEFSIKINYIFQSTKEGYVVVSLPDGSEEIEISVSFR